MLANLEIHATIPASDLARAKQFYAEQLGFAPARETPGGLIYQCRDSMVPALSLAWPTSPYRPPC